MFRTLPALAVALLLPFAPHAFRMLGEPAPVQLDPAPSVPNETLAQIEAEAVARKAASAEKRAVRDAEYAERNRVLDDRAAEIASVHREVERELAAIRTDAEQSLAYWLHQRSQLAARRAHYAQNEAAYVRAVGAAEYADMIADMDANARGIDELCAELSATVANAVMP
ncbi:hypothetical protein [Lacipirellula sp.]|uniref:hypothetical protein n=1 Tax=Lacipirellula sp. TaxID=2691419 RepID=UPI003D09DC98